MRTLERDTEWLRERRIMDYSLLLGVVLPKEIPSSPRLATAAVVNTNTKEQSAMAKKRWGFAKQSVRAAVRMAHKQHSFRTMAEMIGGETGGAMQSTADALADDGKIGGTDSEHAGGIIGHLQTHRSDGSVRLQKCYVFAGVIDILQGYGTKKKMEHFYKSIVHDGDTCSVHNPTFYRQRFVDFTRSTIFTPYSTKTAL